MTRHVLPPDPDGNTTWFARQNPFEQQVIRRQVAFKQARWPALRDGPHVKFPAHTYPHVLPLGQERLAFYEPYAAAIFNYLKAEDIALHSEVLNLKSSQVACLNVLYPLRANREWATVALRPVLPDVREVTALEFEYTGPIDATRWLGEPAGGKRGQNRTSIDAAIFWIDQHDRTHATLVEWKYTERNFGVCSAFSTADAAAKANCLNLDFATNDEPARVCLLCQGQPQRSRRYWEHSAVVGLNRQAFSAVKGCPFQGPFYQLWRQFLLAAYLRLNHVVDEAEVLSCSFAKNTALAAVPPQLRPLMSRTDGTLVDTWNTVLAAVPPLRHLAVEQLMAAIDDAPPIDPGWRDYVHERYGV